MGGGDWLGCGRDLGMREIWAAHASMFDVELLVYMALRSGLDTCKSSRAALTSSFPSLAEESVVTVYHVLGVAYHMPPKR